MSRTRDIIEEIAEVRGRRKSDFAMAELPSRLRKLEELFNSCDKSNKELIRYFPVGLIACVEGYFRLAIRQLIDKGEPYLTNSEKSAASIKIDFAVLRAVHGKQITVGELIGHTLPMSRLDHIEGVLSNLLGESFLQKLRTTTDRWSHEIRGLPLKAILEKPDEIYINVARTFELRHIICHELATAYPIDPDEIANCFESCVRFLRASDECISETLHPGAPLTQSEMNNISGQRWSEAKSQMVELVGEIRRKLRPERIPAFDESQAKWESFCDSWSKFDADECAGGTIWPTLFNSNRTKMTEDRIAELSNYLKFTKFW